MISESHPNGRSARTLLSDDLSLAQRRRPGYVAGTDARLYSDDEKLK